MVRRYQGYLCLRVALRGVMGLRRRQRRSQKMKN